MRTTRVLALSLLVASCGREGPATKATPVDGAPVEQVVARVGAQVISGPDVAARINEGGVDAKEALEALVDEALLVEHAHRLGLRPGADAALAAERVMVRAMLRDLERANAPESITDEEVQADFDARQDVYTIPERRGSWHILVKDVGPEGRTRARAIHAELSRAADPRAVYERYAAEGEGASTLEIVAEELPTVPYAARLEKPYKDAMFEIESEGLVKEIVETSYGWHSIVVTEILPEERLRMADVESDIRTRLSLQKRAATLEEVLQALMREGLVEIDDARAERILAKSGRLSRADAPD